MKITHIRHKDIDRTKWDACLQAAVNALPYAEAWYLDVVSPGWEALVAGDYDYVMPLPRKRRYGISYLVQPPLTQQLGIFSRNEINEKITEHFIRKIPYLSYHLNLNECNVCARAVALPNYVLDLRRTYDELYGGFSKNTKRNIAKAQHAGITVREDLTPSEFLDFYYATEKNYAAPNRTLATRLVEAGFSRSALALYGVCNREGALVAALCLLTSERRSIYLLPVSNDEGKRCSAMFGVIDHIVRSSSPSVRMLDFEGSRIEGIARFYQGFGSEKREYYGVKRLHP